MEQKISLVKGQQLTESQRKDQKALEFFGIPYKQCCPLQQEEVRRALDQEDQEA